MASVQLVETYVNATLTGMIAVDQIIIQVLGSNHWDNNPVKRSEQKVLKKYAVMTTVMA